MACIFSYVPCVSKSVRNDVSQIVILGNGKAFSGNKKLWSACDIPIGAGAMQTWNII